MVSWTEDYFGESSKTGLVFVENASIVHGGICGSSMVGWIEGFW